MRTLFVALLVLTLAVWGAVLVEERGVETATEREGQTAPEAIEPEVPSQAALPSVPAIIAQEGQRATSVQPGPLVVSEPPPPPAPAPIVYDEEYVARLARAIHDRTNVVRVLEGAGILEYDERLAGIALLHSTDMVVNDYFAHEDEYGCDVACRVTASDYRWRMVGENLFLLRSPYRYSVEDASAIIVYGWMGSDSHRRNLLEEIYTHEGIGVVIRSDSIHATQVLARPR